MGPSTLGRALGAGVATVALLNTLAGLSMPLPDRAPDPLRIIAWLGLLSLHAVTYWNGERLRSRFRLRAYAAAQATILFLIALSAPPAPVTTGLFMAGTAEMVVLGGVPWGSVRITLGAIAIFVLASLITADLYRAATAGLLFSLTGVVAHAAAGLLGRPAPVAAVPQPAAEPLPAANGAAGLSAREVEVLRALARGARNSAIAAQLGITERTVKAHLGSIYQKLGVTSRAAAVAVALERKLV
jgi:DNA-binding CsgD family transcriptional regulator